MPQLQTQPIPTASAQPAPQPDSAGPGTAASRYRVAADALSSASRVGSARSVGNAPAPLGRTGAHSALGESTVGVPAERADRVERGYCGSFTALAPDLTAHYDVVSMFDYLECGTEPDREVRAAHQAVRPGGHPQTEGPDPDSRYARLLGRWWFPWLRRSTCTSSRSHFVPVDHPGAG